MHLRIAFIVAASFLPTALLGLLLSEGIAPAAEAAKGRTLFLLDSRSAVPSTTLSRSPKAFLKPTVIPHRSVIDGMVAPEDLDATVRYEAAGKMPSPWEEIEVSFLSRLKSPQVPELAAAEQLQDSAEEVSPLPADHFLAALGALKTPLKTADDHTAFTLALLPFYAEGTLSYAQ